MFLNNGMHIFNKPFVPPELDPWISWCSHRQLNDSENQAFQCALLAFAAEMRKNPSGLRMCPVNIVLLDTPEISIFMDSEDAMGHALNLIVLPLYRWSESHLTPVLMTICILEELCHMFYAEYDEIRVEALVTACARYLWPNVQVTDIYNPHWKPD